MSPSGTYIHATGTGKILTKSSKLVSADDNVTTKIRKFTEDNFFSTMFDHK